jgi:hypothetical protein
MPAQIMTDRTRLCAGVAALAVVLRAPTITSRLFDPDEAAIGVQAMVIRHGGTLYTDIFDRKPPLPPLLYAASFALTDSNDVRLMRVVVTILLACCGVLVALDARRRWGTTGGWWAGVLLIAGAMATFPADAGAANFAHFALLPGTAAIIWSRRGTLGSAIAAGVAIGLAILTRQSWLLGVLPGAVSVGMHGRWRHVGPFLVAAAATVATTGFYAPLGRFWEWNVTNSPGFVFAGTSVGRAAVNGLTSAGGFVIFHPVIVVGASVSSAAVLTAARAKKLPADVDLWLWALIGLAAWAAGFRFFGHYWLQILPPLVMLTTPIVTRCSASVRRLAVAGIVIPAAVAWAFLYVPGSFRDRPDPAELAGYVRDHTLPTDRVFVWGSYPEVLVAADRLPAGGLVHTDFVVGRSGGRNTPAEALANALPEAKTIMLDSLTRTPPRLILDTSTAPHLGYTKFPTTLIPELDRFIHAGYDQVSVVDDVTVWMRRP